VKAVTDITLLTIFLIIGGIGFLFLLISLVVGDVFELVGLNFDFGGDGGDFGFFDSRVISVFVTAFGGFGAVGAQFGWSALASSLFGLLGGVVFGGVVALFGRFLYSQQASSSISAANLIGRTAQVTVSIQPNQIGQISCRVGEERIEKLARSKDGTEIKTGSIVKIEEILGDSVLVSLDKN
jgi:hypothetical protein